MEDLIKSEPEEKAVEPVEPTEAAERQEPARPAVAERTSVETHRVQPPIWRLLAAILAVIIIAALLILGARWIYHATHHTTKLTPANSNKLPKQPSGATNNTSPNSPQASGSAKSSSSSSASGSGSQIANTGPGDTIALLAGSSLAAAGLHYIWTLRRRQDY